MTFSASRYSIWSCEPISRFVFCISITHTLKVKNSGSRADVASCFSPITCVDRLRTASRSRCRNGPRSLFVTHYYEGTPEVTHAVQVGSPLENVLAMYRTAGSLAEEIDDSILSIEADEDAVDEIDMSKLF